MLLYRQICCQRILWHFVRIPELGGTVKIQIAGVCVRHTTASANTPAMTEACSRLLQFNQFLCCLSRAAVLYMYVYGGAKIDRVLLAVSEMS